MGGIGKTAAMVNVLTLRELMRGPGPVLVLGEGASFRRPMKKRAQKPHRATVEFDHEVWGLVVKYQRREKRSGKAKPKLREITNRFLREGLRRELGGI